VAVLSGLQQLELARNPGMPGSGKDLARHRGQEIAVVDADLDLQSGVLLSLPWSDEPWKFSESTEDVQFWAAR
jgi:hypothetical protein